ncbi:MAG: M14 family zinc carboxypeptidase, partial [Nannocystaceae bacterium]
MRPLRWTSPACLGLLLVLGGGTASAESLATRTSNHGDVLVQVEAWPEDLLELGFDVWTHHTTTRQALVRVPPQQRALLDATGLSYSIVEPDLGPLVEAESARLAAAARPVAGGSLDPAYYDDYRDLADVQDRLDALISTHPERASLVEIGLSLEGRPIRGVRLSNPGPDDRPVVVVQACQHAREWISVAATMWAAEQLATAPVGGALDGLLDDAELVVVPVVNPDGYQYSWTNERFWRKNRREDFGVDLNRNWSVAWGGQGASNYPYDENYRGAAAFSEPESTAMRDFIAADPHARASLDVHSYGQLVLYPWGFQLDPAPDDLMLSGTSEDIAEAMGLPHGSVYIPLQSAALYPAAGNAMDWA